MIWKFILRSLIICLFAISPLSSGSNEGGLSSNRAGFRMFPLIRWCWIRKLPQRTPMHECWGPYIHHIINFCFVRQEGWRSYGEKSALSLADVCYGSPAFWHVSSVYTLSYLTPGENTLPLHPISLEVLCWFKHPYYVRSIKLVELKDISSWTM